jgi:hypothetical protein
MSNSGLEEMRGLDLEFRLNPASRKCARKSNKLMLGVTIKPCYRVA